jgi:hypothetical protein
MTTTERIVADVLPLLPHLETAQLLEISERNDDCIRELPNHPDLQRLRGRINGELQRRAKNHD